MSGSLRLSQTDPRDDTALINALRWVIRRLRQAFLTAGAPTSVPRVGATADDRAANHPAPRPGGSMLRRME